MRELTAEEWKAIHDEAVDNAMSIIKHLTAQLKEAERQRDIVIISATKDGGQLILQPDILIGDPDEYQIECYYCPEDNTQRFTSKLLDSRSASAQTKTPGD